MPCALDRRNELPLVLRARSGNALRYDFPLLAREALDLLFVLVINVVFFGITKATRTLLAQCLGFLFAF